MEWLLMCVCYCVSECVPMASNDITFIFFVKSFMNRYCTHTHTHAYHSLPSVTVSVSGKYVNLQNVSTRY